MNLYLLLDGLVLLFPLLLSFDRRVSFFRQWRAVFPAVLAVGALFIAEDVVATRRGHWAFSEAFAGEIRPLDLPLGEWLFFIVVPYACLFIYACVRGYQKERILPVPRWLPFAVAAAAAVVAILYHQQGYTRSIMILFAGTWIFIGLLRPDLVRSLQWWTGMALTYAMFLVVNGVLTGIPVVTYNPEAIWGFRVITIPLEDFFYSFSLLALNFTLFRFFLDGGRRPSPEPGAFAGPGGVGSTTMPLLAYRFMEKGKRP